MQLELPDAELTRMVFDGDGAGLVTHLELEVVSGSRIQVPRRLALPQSLHTRALLRREALRQESLEEAGPAANPDAKDPEAAREIAP